MGALWAHACVGFLWGSQSWLPPAFSRRKRLLSRGALWARQPPGTSGVTLIELMVVVAIIALMVGVSFPAVTSGIDSLRLNAASSGVVSFFNSALNRAERRQQVVEVTISKAENAVWMRSSEAGFLKRMEMPDGITIMDVLPKLEEEDPEAARSFMLYPGGTVPRFGVQIANRRHAERIVRVDPMTGVPRIEKPEP